MREFRTSECAWHIAHINPVRPE